MIHEHLARHLCRRGAKHFAEKYKMYFIQHIAKIPEVNQIDTGLLNYRIGMGISENPVPSRKRPIHDKKDTPHNNRMGRPLEKMTKGPVGRANCEVAWSSDAAMRLGVGPDRRGRPPQVIQICEEVS